MKRRDFIKGSIVAATTTGMLPSCSSIPSSDKKFLSGFIFSDAHIGWKGADQPSIEEQSAAIQLIKKQFPNIDLVFDTGDLHHGYLNEKERNKARDQWLKCFISPFSEKIFHYIPGNHELGNGPTDTELIASSIGSHNLRPYYSFDYNGIHFISVPQLLDTILVNKETIDWLAHDLEISKNSTTIIMSHNSISNTTYNNGENGYRSVINSTEVLAVINKHKNVIAWLHGHNHNYEIVKQHNRLYVSNGRIGGFDPPKSWGSFGHGHLGGIYFSINQQGLVIKCFSATKNNFLASLGYKKLSAKLSVETTFNPDKGFTYYYGHGSLTNNVTHNIINHYLSSDNDITIFTKAIKDKALNDNSNFDLTSELFFTGQRLNKTVGYKISPNTILRKTATDGLQLENIVNGKIKLELPARTYKKSDFMPRPSYFRCEAGDTFKVDLIFTILDSMKSTCIVKYEYFIYDNNLDKIFQSGVLNTTNNNGIILVDKIVVYNETKSSIVKKNKYLQLVFYFEKAPEKITLNKLSLVKTGNVILNELTFDEKSYNLNDSQKLLIDQKHLNTNGKSSLNYKGSLPLSCVIKLKNIEWQIRNAISILKNNEIKLLDYRHNYQLINEVIITPIDKHKNIYLNKVIEIMPLKITYNKNKIKLSFEKINSKSQLVFKFRKIPKKVIGAHNLTKTNNTLIIYPKSRNIEIYI